MIHPQLFNGLEEIRQKSLISDRWRLLLGEALDLAHPGIFGKLFVQNSGAVRDGGHHSICVLEHTEVGQTTPTLYRIIAPGVPIHGVVLDDLGFVIEAETRRRKIALILHWLRQANDGVMPQRLGSLYLLDHGFSSSAAGHRVWRELIIKIRRTHMMLHARYV